MQSYRMDYWNIANCWHWPLLYYFDVFWTLFVEQTRAEYKFGVNYPFKREAGMHDKAKKTERERQISDRHKTMPSLLVIIGNRSVCPRWLNWVNIQTSCDSYILHACYIMAQHAHSLDLTTELCLYVCIFWTRRQLSNWARLGSPVTQCEAKCLRPHSLMGLWLGKSQYISMNSVSRPLCNETHSIHSAMLNEPTLNESV